MTDQPPTTEATRLSAKDERLIRLTYGSGAHGSVAQLLAELDALRAENARLTEQVAAAEREHAKRLETLADCWKAVLDVIDQNEIIKDTLPVILQRVLGQWSGWVIEVPLLRGSLKQAEAALAESRSREAELREALIQLTLTNLDDLILPTCLVCGQIGEHADEIIHKPTCVFRTILAAASPAPPQEPVWSELCTCGHSYGVHMKASCSVHEVQGRQECPCTGFEPAPATPRRPAMRRPVDLRRDDQESYEHGDPGPEPILLDVSRTVLVPEPPAAAGPGDDAGGAG